jgi:hypothetical protein
MEHGDRRPCDDVDRERRIEGLRIGRPGETENGANPRALRLSAARAPRENKEDEAKRGEELQLWRENSPVP